VNGYFAHQSHNIAFRIVKETHPQIMVIHPGNQVRFIIKLDVTGTEQFIL